MSSYPKSPKEMTKGIMYFPRMLDKIRLHAREELSADYHPNLGGARAADGTCCNFLRVNTPIFANAYSKAELMKRSWSGVSKKAVVSMKAT